MKKIVCDYLIVGAGATPLAFLDTLLTEQPDAKVVLVDRKTRPGGHWVNDYDFVHLHQPSVVYGISSKQLEGNWLKVMFTRFMLPWQHRASKQEILDYFQEFVDDNVASGRLQYFPESSYKFGKKFDGTASFSTLDGKDSYDVEVREKIVDGTKGECIIPSLSPPKFPVDKSINLMTPNQIYDLYQRESKPTRGYSSYLPSVFSKLCGPSAKTGVASGRKFVVLGAGKTAMDTVVFLQTSMGVSPSDISWVIPNDVWMMSREDSQGPFIYLKALLENDNDKEKTVLDLEKRGMFVRLDPKVTPTRFRFPVIGKDELKLMRKVTDIVRKGRVSNIRKDGDSTIVSFETGKDDWVIPKEEGTEHIFVHCTSPGPFNDTFLQKEVFPTDKEITLQLLYAPPISISMSCIAKVECARKAGTLDLEFGRKLLKDDKASADDVIRVLIRGLAGLGEDGTLLGKEPSFLDEIRPTITQAMFMALLDKDPMVGLNWNKSNRLSMLSIPGAKASAVEDLELILEKGKALGCTPDELELLRKVAEKLEPIRGM